ncbi:OTU domain-containing protein 2 [[Candida] railenensis]|uniref:OTU domain-containing protein 2 n=1 Tax=[Candida] railenensis TaxID=45579 RepID=A0A9P0VX54_9ASCO|nr:OTU domain-containing protein 2 [[Candida] railenensis]
MSSDSDPVEALLVKHRKELRDLTATITSLKKQATKKTRKNVLSNCSRMEAELKEKQASELSDLKSGSGSGVGENEYDEITPEKLLASMQLSENSDNTTNLANVGKNVSEETMNNSISKSPVEKVQENAPAGPKKRNRQKERLAKRQAEIDRLTEEARLEALIVPDYKKLESEAMAAAIEEKGLTLHEIQPDGNCLFSSFLDQLNNIDIEGDENNADEITKIIGTGLSINDLRRLAAEYMLKNKDTFVPFMYNEQTDELEDIEEYCHQLTTTSMWGSDKEILAFSEIFKRNVDVLSYDVKGNKVTSLVIGNDSFASHPPLNIAYYKHCYGLGEHYNSLRE